MHGLGHIGSAVVDEDPAGRRHGVGAQPVIGGDLARADRKGGVREPKVDESRPGDFDGRELRRAFEGAGDRGGDLARVPADALGRGQGAVALEVRQVGPVRRGGAGQFDRQAKGSERPGEALVDGASQRGHFGVRLPAAAVWAPASRRNRFPSRLNSAMAGVTSKPTSTSKLEPEVVRVARGMTMPSIRSMA